MIVGLTYSRENLQNRLPDSFMLTVSCSPATSSHGCHWPPMRHVCPIPNHVMAAASEASLVKGFLAEVTPNFSIIFRHYVISIMISSDTLGEIF